MRADVYWTAPCPWAEKVEIGLLKRFSTAERDRFLKLLAVFAKDRT
jgi:hypothetical protein